MTEISFFAITAGLASGFLAALLIYGVYLLLGGPPSRTRILHGDKFTAMLSRFRRR